MTAGRGPGWRSASVMAVVLGSVAGLIAFVPRTGIAVSGRTITVGTTADSAANSAGCPSTGPNTFGGSSCSLRDALTLANQDGDGDTVIIPGNASHYTLTPANGSLQIDAPVTVKGDSAKTVVIDGGHTTGGTGIGVLLIDPGLNPDGTVNTTTTSTAQTRVDVAVSISGVTIQNGFTLRQIIAAAGPAVTRRTTADAAGIDVHSSNHVFTASLTLTDSALVGNTSGGNASAAGGLSVRFNDSVMTTLNRVTIAGNTNSGFAGGADIEGDATIVDATFSGNSGGQVGALALGGGSVADVDYSTFADNISTRTGGGTGGIFNNESAIGLGGDLLSGNTPVNCGSTMTDEGHNFDSDGSCGLGNANSNVSGTSSAKLDPGLQPLKDNGGAVQTRGLADGSKALGLQNQPCTIIQINLGGQGSTTFTQDARTFPRPSLRGTTCDAGAFQKQIAAADPGQFKKGPQPPPGGFDPEFPAGGFTLPDPLPATGSFTTQPIADPSATGVTVTLTIPAGALPGGTQVAYYHGQPPVLNGQIPAGKSTVDGMAVTWNTPINTQPDAAKNLTLTVKDPAVPANGVLYLCTVATTAACTTPAPGATVQAGQWAALFTTDPGFVLAQAAAAPATPAPTPPPDAATSPIRAPVVGGGAPAEAPSPALGALLAVLAAAGLIGGLRRRRA